MSTYFDFIEFKKQTVSYKLLKSWCRSYFNLHRKARFILKIINNIFKSIPNNYGTVKWIQLNFPNEKKCQKMYKNSNNFLRFFRNFGKIRKYKLGFPKNPGNSPYTNLNLIIS